MANCQHTRPANVSAFCPTADLKFTISNLRVTQNLLRLWHKSICVSWHVQLASSWRSLLDHRPMAATRQNKLPKVIAGKRNGRESNWILKISLKSRILLNFARPGSEWSMYALTARRWVGAGSSETRSAEDQLALNDARCLVSSEHTTLKLRSHARCALCVRWAGAARFCAALANISK